MKMVIRTALFHLLCILIFAWIYLYLSEHFQTNSGEKNKKYSSFLDYFLLSTTIQVGVGISDLYPVSVFSKIAVIIQQFIMLFTHIITLYFFTL